MPGRAHAKRRPTPIAGFRIALVAATLLLLGPAAAQAAWTSSIGGNTVTMTEDGGGTLLEIGVIAGNLSHNLSGQPGFGNSQDFDSFNAGIQTVANSASVNLTINGGPGFDTVNIGDLSTPASAIAASVSATGGAGNSDNLQIIGFQEAADHTVAIAPDSVSGLGGVRAYSGFESLGVSTGEGNDVVNVAAGVPELFLGTSAGTDRIVLADGAKVRVDGGAGTDTLDYSAWTTPVSTLPPEFAHFRADLTAAQEVTPSTSTATGAVFISIDLATGEIELISANVTGITPAQEAGSHIQLGGPGVDGAIIFDLETGPQPDAAWSPTGGGMTLNVIGNGGVFPPSNITDLVVGNTFVNIRSTNLRCGDSGNQACSEGEIRGQILPSDIGFTADSSSGFFNAIENIVGGAAGDTINGNPLANIIDGGPGADIIRGAETGDDINGGAGADDIGGGSGDDRLRANDGETDTSIDCGPGSDIADRDPAVIDPDSLLVECETVNTTLPLGTISPIKARVKRNRDGTFTIVTGARAECPPTASAECELTARASARVEVGPGNRTLRKRRVTLGRLNASVAPGASQRVRIKLSRKGSRRFAANDPLPVRIRINLEVPDGQPATLQRSQRLRVPKRRR